MPLQHPRVHVPKLRPRVLPEVPRPRDVRRAVLVLPPRVDQYRRLPVQVLEQAAPLGRAVAHDGAASAPVATPAAVVAEMLKAFPYLFEGMEYKAWTKQAK